MRIAAALCAAVFVALVVLFTLLNSRELPPEELLRRCAASRPAWNGYQEDIKAIGARAVARWQGEPVALAVLPESVMLSMRLQSPWDAWDAALPLLLMDPEGHVHQNSAAVREGALRIYQFPAIPGAAQSPPPWVEIQYPHTKRRLHLDPGGRWYAGDADAE